MKTHPILFSGPMVKTILEGRKTQTRRVIKPQPSPEMVKCGCGITGLWIGWDAQENEVWASRCRYGVPGDRLAVKETYYRWGYWRGNGLTKTGKQRWIFVGNHNILYADNPPKDVKSNSDHSPGWYKRNSLFMPMWAVRLFLSLVTVRVERVQDISEADAIAEGIDYYKKYGWYRDYLAKPEGESHPFNDAVRSYQSLWDSINDPFPVTRIGHAWVYNPWVWVLEFRRAE